jgi:hypothetical protein
MSQNVLYENLLPSIFDLRNEPVTISLDVEDPKIIDEVRVGIGLRMSSRQRHSSCFAALYHTSKADSISEYLAAASFKRG